jgi:hypothetical protein
MFESRNREESDLRRFCCDKFIELLCSLPERFGITTVPHLPDQKATGFQSCEFPYYMFVDQFLASSDQP